jgi:hypothetical protein
VLAPFGKSENADFAEKNGRFCKLTIGDLRNSSTFWIASNDFRPTFLPLREEAQLT